MQGGKAGFHRSEKPRERKGSSLGLEKFIVGVG